MTKISRLRNNLPMPILTIILRTIIFLVLAVEEAVSVNRRSYFGIRLLSLISNTRTSRITATADSHTLKTTSLILSGESDAAFHHGKHEASSHRIWHIL